MTPIRFVENPQVRVDISDRETMKVGTGSHTITLSVLDAAGQPIPFSGVAGVSLPTSYGVLSATTTEILSGTSMPLTLRPGAVAVREGVLDVQVPGIPRVTGTTFTILP